MRLLLSILCLSQAPAPEPDPSTLNGKVICGYQGWFRCPGDPSGEGWRHWSRHADRITPRSLTVDMWPDLSEYEASEKYPAPGFHYPDGTPAHLLSSVNARTVDRHFDWMKHYGIDGVFLQRFLVNIGTRSFDQVLDNVRNAAKRTGRVYCVGYDMTGAPESRLVEILAADWKKLVAEVRLTRDPTYLHHQGKPVVFVWGFFPDRFPPSIAHKMIDIFKSKDECAATLIGGCPWYWRTEKDPEWARAFRRFDVLSPWNVGNHSLENGQRHASTGSWPGDLAETKAAGIDYLPVIYPGFSWTNLQGPRAANETIPRLGGAFFWRQFQRVAELKIDMAYVAMFDEVDEGTAIFKVTNEPPREAHFATFEGLPSDWYLRLTAEGARLLRGERPMATGLPIKP
jgi:hypothetical protein